MILTIATIIAVITVVLAWNIAGTMIKNQAIDGCYHAGRLEFTNSSNQKATVPDNYWYDDCMGKKGYKVTVKK